jgi:hypothetical protein
MRPAAITVGKNKRCVNTSQWYDFQSCLSNGFCIIAARVRLASAKTLTTSTRGMNTASNAHSVKRRNVEKKFIDRKVNTQIAMMGYGQLTKTGHSAQNPSMSVIAIYHQVSAFVKINCFQM